MKTKMKKLIPTIYYLAISIFLLTNLSCNKSESPFIGSKSVSIDMDKAREEVDSLDKKFSEYFFNGDSIALYQMYAKGATFGSIKGEEILSAWGRQIRNSIKNDTRNLLFTPIFLTTDNEFLFEVGKYVSKDSKGNVKDNGKYLMVLKQEEDQWKIYRDMGL
jgi:ketosteroid isomerase-like protein